MCGLDGVESRFACRGLVTGGTSRTSCCTGIGVDGLLKFRHDSREVLLTHHRHDYTHSVLFLRP